MTPLIPISCQLTVVSRDIGSRNAAQGRETHMLLKNATAIQRAHQIRTENLLAETHTSLATIQRQHEALGDFTANSVAMVDSAQMKTPQVHLTAS